MYPLDSKNYKMSESEQTIFIDLDAGTVEESEPVPFDAEKYLAERDLFILTYKFN